jgi:hypothetical protein
MPTTLWNNGRGNCSMVLEETKPHYSLTAAGPPRSAGCFPPVGGGHRARAEHRFNIRRPSVVAVQAPPPAGRRELGNTATGRTRTMCAAARAQDCERPQQRIQSEVSGVTCDCEIRRSVRTTCTLVLRSPVRMLACTACFAFFTIHTPAASSQEWLPCARV